MPDPVAEPRLSFDEFKLYYESTEKVTDRRLETNRWNYSICIATLVAIAVLIRWSLTTVALLWVGLTGVALLSLMAVLFCMLWVGQVRDFKMLNKAKFEILNDMAHRVDFKPDAPGSVLSFCPFEKEWKRLDELKALHEVGASDIIALKSSNSEYFIPKAFAILFAGVLLTLPVVVALNWPPTKLVRPETPAAVQVK
jgi:hypothetical protein